MVKVQQSVLANCRSRKFQEVEAPKFQDIRYMKVVRSALCTAHLYTPWNIPGTHFFQGPSWRRGHCVACKIMSMRNLNDTIRNGTHIQLVMQSEQPPPLCAVQFWIMLIELNKVLCLDKSVCVTRLPQASGNEPCQKVWFWVFYILIALEINKYIVEKCICTV